MPGRVFPGSRSHEVRRFTRLVGLGPQSGLHRGVHRSLMAVPPAGISYRLVSMDHVLVLPPDLPPSASPFLHLHWFEGVTTREKPKLIHSARWPVLGCAAWVVDTDDMFVPILLGRAYLIRGVSGSVRIRRSLVDSRWRDVMRRCANMLTAYAHDSCLGILCRTEWTRKATAVWIDTLRVGRVGELVTEKLHIMYPAQRPISHERLTQKWGAEQTLHVVFCCGRDYDRKNASMALTVFARISAQRQDVKFTYVGPVPSADAPRGRWNSGRLTLASNLSRDDIRELMTDAHILFHPSHFETLGIVLVEAAAAGMAIVVAKGSGMNSVHELLGEDGALFVDRATVGRVAEEQAFEKCLLELLEDRERARQLGMRNHAVMGVAPWSVGHRDELLRRLYAKSETRVRLAGLRLGDLPYGLDGLRRVVSDADVMNEEALWWRALGLPESIDLPFDLPQECAARGLESAG